MNNNYANLTYNRGIHTVYVDSRFVSEFKWFLIVEQSELEGQEEIINTLWRNIFFGLIITFSLMWLANRILSKYQLQIETLATTDTLTQAATRQALDSYYEHITSKSDSPVSLILLDIDDFKKVNDKHGHNAGDEIIKIVSEVLLQGRRDSDLLCRWGGEEFILLLPNTDLKNAYDIAERLRILIASKIISINNVEITISASFGVAQKQRDESKVSLINRADLNLYNAKHLGKNRVEMSGVTQ